MCYLYDSVSRNYFSAPLSTQVEVESQYLTWFILSLKSTQNPKIAREPMRSVFNKIWFYDLMKVKPLTPIDKGTPFDRNLTRYLE